MAREPRTLSEDDYMEEYMEKDVRTMWANMQYKEREIQQKRLFLMGLSDTDALAISKGKPHFLPESLLRKDDLFFEDLKKIVEKSCGMNSDDTERHTSHDYNEFRSMRHMSRVVLGLLDDFNNNGLYCIARLLTADLVTFEKTRTQMEKIIRKNLDVLKSQQCPKDQTNILSEVSKLLGVPSNFRNPVKHLNVTLKSHRDVLTKVLDGLGDVPTLALSAMYRKLKGIHGYLPQLRPAKSGWNRNRLIERVRAICLEIIGQLGESDVLPEPLAKAMAVASLSAKLVSGYEDLSSTRFVHLTPEVETLQREILQAIHNLGQRTNKKETAKLLQLLDPKSEMGTVGAKAIKNMLTEFLYECSEMNAFPDSLLDALSIVNKKPSHRLLSKDVIEEHIEEILNLSAAIKQILLDKIPGDNLERDFADAYVEELVESDDGDFFDDDDDEEEDELLTKRLQGIQIRLNAFTEEVQSTGDSWGASSSSSLGDSSSSSSGVAGDFGDDECMSIDCSGSRMLFPTSSKRVSSSLGCNDKGRQDAAQNKSADLVNSAANFHSGSSLLEENPMSESHKKSRNQYVAIQKFSDQASLSLYRVIRHLMEELAKVEELSGHDAADLRGGSSKPQHSEDQSADSKGKSVSGSAKGTNVSDAVVRAFRKVMPSFPSRELEKIKNILNS